MTNEWEEFKAYTGQPVYAAANKHDTAFYSRITLNMIKAFADAKEKYGYPELEKNAFTSFPDGK